MNEKPKTDNHLTDKAELESSTTQTSSTTPDAKSLDVDYMAGRFLLATPNMMDPRFQNALIYICSHDESGAMGLIINQPKAGLLMSDLLDQIGVEGHVQVADTPVLNGGPVDIDRGFVLHTADYFKDETSLKLSDTLHLTSTKDILEALVTHDAPSQAMIAIGYSGWGKGQLEREISQNSWLVIDADEALIFDSNLEAKRDHAFQTLGITPEMLSFHGGTA